jgi:hypothetical protein
MQSACTQPLCTGERHGEGAGNELAKPPAGFVGVQECLGRPRPHQHEVVQIG